MMNKLAAALLAAVTTLGCASENDGAFHITGRLADATQVSHVIATNPTTGERIVIDMKSDGQADGQFNVALPTSGAWIVTFVDASKTGAAMRIATLQTGGLDAFAPKAAGSMDFGTVTFSGHYAHGTMSWETLEDAFAASRAELERTAKIDNLSLRYSNPDVDGDGKIDALQARNFALDIEGTYRLQTTDGTDLSINDLVKGVDAPTVRYLGTSIKAVVPRAMGMNMLSGSIMFEAPYFGTALGLDSTPMVAPRTRIGAPHLKFGELAGDPVLGVVAHPGHDAPSGTYQFAFDSDKLTFTDVMAPSAARLMTATDYAVPFVRIRPVNAGCVSDCEISSIDIEWMRNTGAGWVSTGEEIESRLEVVAKLNGADTYLAANMGEGATTLVWSAMPLANTGLLRNELSYISTSELCYVAVSYTTELGMKMTSQVQNPACF